MPLDGAVGVGDEGGAVTRPGGKTKVDAGKLFVTDLYALGNVFKEHEVFVKISLMLLAFKGADAVAAAPNLCNRVCVAIPSVEVTMVPTGALKNRLHD